jgi:hypothetical protein
LCFRNFTQEIIQKAEEKAVGQRGGENLMSEKAIHDQCNRTFQKWKDRGSYEKCQNIF